MTINLLNYMTWQYKIRKVIPSIASISADVDSLFMTIATNNKISKLASANNSILCRRWRAAGGGRERAAEYGRG